jgi:hypothetical protein
VLGAGEVKRGAWDLTQRAWRITFADHVEAPSLSGAIGGRLLIHVGLEGDDRGGQADVVLGDHESILAGRDDASCGGAAGEEDEGEESNTLQNESLLSIL